MIGLGSDKNTNAITEKQIHKVVAQVQGPHHLLHQPFLPLLLLLSCVSPPTDPGALIFVVN